MPFDPSGVLTLTTDFGHKGPYVASMKGVMLSRFRGATIVDLTHETLVHWPAEAGFWLRRAYRFFPSGTVHVAVVDPGVGTGRNIVAAELDGHVFLAPDNGLLASLLSAGPPITIHQISDSALHKLGITDPSPTFHGRDIFAPVAAALAAGDVLPADLGPNVEPDELVPSWIEDAALMRGEVHGTVVTFDHFGNIITNIDASLVADFDAPVLNCAGHDFPMRRTYGEHRPGEYLALVNSFGVVELARAEASAHASLGAERGAPVIARERTD